MCVFLIRLKTTQTVELKVEMVGIHEKRLRKCLSKLRGNQDTITLIARSRHLIIDTCMPATLKRILFLQE